MDMSTKHALLRPCRSSKVSVLISHDRELLDKLCTACCLQPDNGTANMKSGNYSQPSLQVELERSSTIRKGSCTRKLTALSESQRRREEASRVQARKGIKEERALTSMTVMRAKKHKGYIVSRLKMVKREKIGCTWGDGLEKAAGKPQVLGLANTIPISGWIVRRK